MGGRGSEGVRSSSSNTISSDINEFLKELNVRNYGASTKMVPEQQQKEFRRMKYTVSDFLKKNPEQDSVVFSSGFSSGAENPDEYVHTAAKLNSYQRLVRSEAKGIQTDLSLGVITKEEAQLELKALKSLDKMIQNRRRS